MDEALGKLDGINDALRKKSAHERAREIKERVFDEYAIDTDDITYFDTKQLLGSGGQGSVYRIKLHGNVCAAKEITFYECRTQTEYIKKVEKVKNEFLIMIKGNQCPNIIQTYGVVEARDNLLLVMEYA